MATPRPHKLPTLKWWGSVLKIKTRIWRTCASSSVRPASSRGAPSRNHNIMTVHQQPSHSNLFKVTMHLPTSSKPERKSRMRWKLKTTPERVLREESSRKQEVRTILTCRTNKTTARVIDLGLGSAIAKNSSLIDPAHTKRLSCITRESLCLWSKSPARNTLSLT